jgi:hypothetical protein
MLTYDLLHSARQYAQTRCDAAFLRGKQYRMMLAACNQVAVVMHVAAGSHHLSRSDNGNRERQATLELESWGKNWDRQSLQY